MVKHFEKLRCLFYQCAQFSTTLVMGRDKGLDASHTKNLHIARIIFYKKKASAR
jgi:hypothetical protein